MVAPDASRLAPPGHDETRGEVTWKTALASLVAVFILGGAAVGGLLLAGRDRGLARADHVLVRLPKEATVVLRLDVGSLRGDASLMRAVEPLWRGALRGAQAWATARATGPIHFFVTPSAGPAMLFATQPRRPGSPATKPSTVHQGVELISRGAMVVATLRGGWQVAGPRPLVTAAIESGLRKRARLPARWDFGTLSSIAAAGREHRFGQVIVLGGPILDAVARRWPAVSGARGLGLFAKIEEATVEVLIVVARGDRGAALKQLDGLLRRMGPAATRLAATLQAEDGKGLILVRGRLPRVHLAPLAAAAASWLHGHFPRGNSL